MHNIIKTAVFIMMLIYGKIIYFNLIIFHIIVYNIWSIFMFISENLVSY